MKCCVTCTFWREVEKPDDDGISVGMCVRFPPVLTMTEADSIKSKESMLTAARSHKQLPPHAAHDFIYWAQPRVLSQSECGEHRSTIET